MAKTYSYQNIIDAFKKIGVTKGKTVLVKSDLRFSGPFEKPNKKSTLESYFNALSEVVSLGEGTIVVPTASHKLINTAIPFDLKNTPSQLGVLNEYIRLKDESVRSFHPFDSYTAIGKNATPICEDVSKHAYGLETPKSRLIDSDAMCVTIGLQPRFCSSSPHHIEMLMGVPYRYTKEYIHPVMRNNKITFEPFYRFVWYRDCQLKRNKNLKISFCKK